MNKDSRRPGRRDLSTIVLAFTALLIVGGASADDSSSDALQWSGTDFSGARVEFPAALAGKPTVMVFWATWCPYCTALMPYLGEVQSELGEDAVNILTVNVFEDGELDPAEHIAALDFPMIAVANGDPIAELYSVRFTPGLMIVDGDGNLVWTRESTDLPPGKTVAEFWAGQVREQLEALL